MILHVGETSVKLKHSDKEAQCSKKADPEGYDCDFAVIEMKMVQIVCFLCLLLV